MLLYWYLDHVYHHIWITFVHVIASVPNLFNFFLQISVELLCFVSKGRLFQYKHPLHAISRSVKTRLVLGGNIRSWLSDLRFLDGIYFSNMAFRLGGPKSATDDGAIIDRSIQRMGASEWTLPMVGQFPLPIEPVAHFLRSRQESMTMAFEGWCSVPFCWRCLEGVRWSVHINNFSSHAFIFSSLLHW